MTKNFHDCLLKRWMLNLGCSGKLISLSWSAWQQTINNKPALFPPFDRLSKELNGHRWQNLQHGSIFCNDRWLQACLSSNRWKTDHISFQIIESYCCSCIQWKTFPFFIEYTISFLVATERNLKNVSDLHHIPVISHFSLPWINELN